MSVSHQHHHNILQQFKTYVEDNHTTYYGPRNIHLFDLVLNKNEKFEKLVEEWIENLEDVESGEKTPKIDVVHKKVLQPIMDRFPVIKKEALELVDMIYHDVESSDDEDASDEENQQTKTKYEMYWETFGDLLLEQITCEYNCEFCETSCV